MQYALQQSVSSDVSSSDGTALSTNSPHRSHHRSPPSPGVGSTRHHHKRTKSHGRQNQMQGDSNWNVSNRQNQRRSSRNNNNNNTYNNNNITKNNSKNPKNTNAHNGHHRRHIRRARSTHGDVHVKPNKNVRFKVK